MGRQVRRVAMDYAHPRDASGRLIPLFGPDATERPRAQRMEPARPGTKLGWCMYETTSEGTPISPVCETKEALAQWLADNDAPAWGDKTATYEEWLRTIKRGSAVSAVRGRDGRMRSGVSAG